MQKTASKSSEVHFFIDEMHFLTIGVIKNRAVVNSKNYSNRIKYVIHKSLGLGVKGGKYFSISNPNVNFLSYILMNDIF